MGRKLKVEVGAINVVMEKHKTHNYIDMLDEISRMDNEVIFRGETRASMSGRELKDSESLEFKQIAGQKFLGTIYKYSELSESTTWHDTKTESTANPETLSQISIPKHLKPHEKQFKFIFFADSHTLIYQAYSKGHILTPKQAVNILSKFFNKPQIINNFGTVTATHFPEELEIKEVLKKFKKIKSIDLKILRPNADHNSGLDEDFLERMESLHVDRIEQSYRASHDDSINVDEELEDTVNFASKNGVSTIKGSASDGTPADYTSKDNPKKEVFYYDSGDVSPDKMFFKGAKSFFSQLFKR